MGLELTDLGEISEQPLELARFAAPHKPSISPIKKMLLISLFVSSAELLSKSNPAADH